MNGRVEDQLKIFNKIEKNFFDLPRFIRNWYFYLKANNCSATTCYDYINKVRRFLDFSFNDYKHIKSSDLNAEMIINYFAYIQSSGQYSDSYRQAIWSCFNNLFNYLTEIDIISENYFNKAHIKRGKNEDLKRINKDRILLTKEDFQKILDAVKYGVGSESSQKYQKTYRNRDMSIMLIFMTTGLRKTALTEINVDDIDMENNKLTIIDKGRIVHEYPLSNEVINYIKKWLIDRYFILGGREHDALFISRNRERITGSSIVKLIDKYANEALGYHISPHKLRSGFASIMYENTKDIEFVRRVVGHSDISTTQRYITTKNDEREKASLLMEELLYKENK